MSNDIKLKLRYTIDNIASIAELKLNCNENLENSFNRYRNTLHLQNNQNETSFYLIRGNERIQLDKNVRIGNLNLIEGDLISISFHNINNETQSAHAHANHNLSSANLNEENDEIVQNNSSNFKNKNIIIMIIALIAILIIGVCLFLTIYFIKKKKNEKDINIKKKDDNIAIGNQTELKKVYNIEELITEKRPYYPINMLFLYKSDKVMKISVETGQEKSKEEINTTTINEYMDFCLFIREENQEIIEELNLTKKWYTGYISLLNLTINNGTHDMHLNYNEEIHKFIQSTNNKNKRNLRKLNESTETLILNEDKELCFVKIDFYENGETKVIFYPKKFNIDNMVYIDKIIKLIIPKLSKNLYTNKY